MRRNGGARTTVVSRARGRVPEIGGSIAHVGYRIVQCAAARMLRLWYASRWAGLYASLLTGRGAVVQECCGMGGSAHEDMPVFCEVRGRVGAAGVVWRFVGTCIERVGEHGHGVAGRLGDQRVGVGYKAVRVTDGTEQPSWGR